MAQLTYRDAVAAGMAQEMRRDKNVVFLGEDVAAAGGVFKTTVGLLDEFGPNRVRDTPISEQAILGAAMGAAMTGLRPIAEIMFSDFFAVCWDIVANEIAKARYMTDGQVTMPLVIKSGNGGGARFGAQHSQSVENWAMAVPGLKIVAPAFPADVKGLMASAVRSDDPVLFFEQKSLYATKGEVPDGEHVVPLGQANVVRQGSDLTIVALALMGPRALTAGAILKEQHGIDATVIDLRSLVPLDTQTILREVAKTGRLVTVEETPRLCGWVAESSSIVAEELFWDLDGPIVRVTTPHIPLAAANNLEDEQIPNADRIVAGVRQLVDSHVAHSTEEAPMDVLMPQLGETVAEGTVANWHKKVGDTVAVDEILFDVETDKVSMEVPSLTAGVITKILVPAGRTVEVGPVLAVIESAAGASAQPPPARAPAPAPAT